MNRQFPAAAGAAAVLVAGLLIGWNPPPSAAQQSPGSWNAERGAVLPSGLSVRLDFSADPGMSVTAGPGKLADRAGGGRSRALYADGLRPGDPAQSFRISEDRPQTDGSWRTVGTLRLTFSRAVRNPRLHLSGLAGITTAKSGSTGTATRLTLTGGSPAAPTLVNRTDWPGWTVDGNTLAPARADGGADGDPGSAAEGSLELAGTFRTAVFRVERRSTARAGSTTAPAPLTQAYTVTLDEGVGTAPQGYGNASHLLSDLYLGGDAATQGAKADGRPGWLFRRADAGRADGGGEGSTDGGTGGGDGSTGGGSGGDGGANPPPPQLQPGRGEYQGADPAVSYPAEAAIGHDYRLTVPVAVGDSSATLAGWVDFNRNGRFDATERVQTDVAPGGHSASLEWTVPADAASGETWARLRIGRDAAQLVPAGGFADSGQVSDQRIRLTVGAARPEISEPVDGTTLAEARPRISGEGAVAGATVEIREGDTALCRTRVARGGDWSCRPDTALAAGRHSLTPVETTGGGVVLRGEPVRITVKTAPPGAPVLTLPEFTNDPGLQLAGTGEPGSTVTVVDRSAGTREAAAGGGGSGGQGTDLCSTGVRPDGGWSCLPVENLADGRHRLTPTAADLAGNRTPGQAVELVVDTVPPDRPVLTAPTAGETLRVARPRLAGRAEPGAQVLVTARPERAAEAARIVACGTTAAVDGSWACTANRDLPEGEQWLVVTATDLAGNGTAAEAVAVTVAPAGGAVAPTPAPTPTPDVIPTVVPSMTPSVTPSVVPSVTPAPTASVAPTPVPTPTVTSTGAPTAVTVVPSSSPTPALSPSPTAAVPSPTVSPSVPVPPTPSTPSAPSAPSAPSVPSPTVAEPVLDPVPSGLLPIVVPPVGGAAGAPVVASPSPSAAPVAVASATGSPSPVVPSTASASTPSTPSAPFTPSVPSPTVAEPVLDPVPSGLLPIVVPPVVASPSASAAPVAVASATGSPSPAVPPTASATTSPSPSPTVTASASAIPAHTATPTPTPTPTPTSTATPSPTAAAATPTGADPDPADVSAPDRDRSDRVRGPAAPPERGQQRAAGPVDPSSPVAADRQRSDAWRGAFAGLLLVLAGIGLITRRVLARGTGTRRR
ncbi:Ig-like domain-containing protein [Kitasatospora sp. MBT66]|uniref:Ig-like domain-containing protein n=1 Tax=Kitasatospora sp. MBT66 TaxID=1444769 RepID=UPI0005BBE36E|nr:Ig-like domain-containing protein [Kitasatospora sp. MBT66]